MSDSNDDKSFFDKMKELISDTGKLTKFFEKTVEFRDQIKLQELNNSYQSEIFRILSIMVDAQQKGIELSNKYHESQREIRQLREELAKREAYTLKQVAFGVFCFVDKEAMPPYSKVRKLCANCYEKGNYSTLRQNHFNTGDEESWSLSCDECSYYQNFPRYEDE